MSHFGVENNTVRKKDTDRKMCRNISIVNIVYLPVQASSALGYVFFRQYLNSEVSQCIAKEMKGVKFQTWCANRIGKRTHIPAFIFLRDKHISWRCELEYLNSPDSPNGIFFCVNMLLTTI